MRRRHRTPIGVLLLYSLALISPQQADVALPRAEVCAWDVEACPSSALSLRSHTAAPASWVQGFRVAVDAGRPLDGSLGQFRLGDLNAIFVARSRSSRARAAASTREHQATRPAIRDAGIGLDASPPRAPPVHL